MSTIVNRELSLLFSSDPNNGSQNLSVDGSSFDVVLSSPLQIPRAAVSCTLSVIQARVWNTSPNISPDFNNNIFNFTTNNSGSPVTYNVVFPSGLYSLSGFNGFLSNFFTNNLLPANLIVVNADESTNQSILTFLVANDTVDFSVANSCKDILGFDPSVVPSVNRPAGWNEYSVREASFNRVNSYLVTSNIVAGGIPINSGGRNVIGSIPITVRVGSQINYDPQNTIEVNALELAGSSKLNISFQLRDQLLRLAPTNGEYWSVIIRIKYGILLTNENVPMLRF